MAGELNQLVEVAVYRAGRVYRAVCLDLGLIVERPNAPEALAELEALIRDYVRDQAEAGHTWEQMQRPVPNSERRHIYRLLMFAEARRFLAALLHGRTVERDARLKGNMVIHQLCPV